MSQTQHLIAKIQHVCQENRDIKENRTYQKSQKTHMKPQASTKNFLHPQNHSNRTPSLNALSSSKTDEPTPREESRIQTAINNSNSTPKVTPQGPQNHAGHPILKNPNFEKSVNNIETTSSIDLGTMNPTLVHPNHPTIIFSEFMDKEWGEVQTEGGKGVNSGGSDQELPSHMIQKSGATMTQETEAGTPQKAEVSLGQEIEEG